MDREKVIEQQLIETKIAKADAQEKDKCQGLLDTCYMLAGLTCYTFAGLVVFLLVWVGFLLVIYVTVSLERWLFP